MNGETLTIKPKTGKTVPKAIIKRLYTVPEAAYYLGRSVDALREMIWAGKLQFFRDGKRVLLDVKDLDIFIEKNKMQFTY